MIMTSRVICDPGPLISHKIGLKTNFVPASPQGEALLRRFAALVGSKTPPYEYTVNNNFSYKIPKKVWVS